MTAISNDFFATPTTWLDLGDCTLPYWRVGAGPDLVLVHGWPLDSRTWRHLLPRLAERFTCHMVDMPGAGQSRWTRDTAFGLVEGGATLKRAIDALGLESYALVAHDSGAVFARLCAIADPDRVKALVLGNTEIPSHVPWQVQVYGAVGRMPGGLTIFQMMLRSKLGRRSPLGFRGCFEDLEFAEGEFYDLFVKPLVEDRLAVEGHAMLGTKVDFSVVAGLREGHGQITAPVRFIWGADDPFFPVDKAREMVDELGGEADLVTLSPGKLFAHEERPDDFVDLALPVLERAFSGERTAAAI